MTMETPRPNILVEPADKIRRDALEKDCELILSGDLSSYLIFENYVANMIEILGTTEPKENAAVCSNPVELEEPSVKQKIHFVKDRDVYAIQVYYEPSTQILAYPVCDDITANPGRPFPFAEVSHYLATSRFSNLNFSSITHQLPVELKIEKIQTSGLSKEEAHAFMRKTFDIYRQSRN